MYKIPDVISQDGLKVMQIQHQRFGDNTIKIINIASQEVLHQCNNNPGLNCHGSFIENDNIVIYLTFDNNWYIPPIVNIWDLIQNTKKEIITPHHPQASNLIYQYHQPSQSLVIAAPHEAVVTTYNLNNLEMMWQSKDSSAFSESDPNTINALDISVCGKMIAVLQNESMTIYHLITGKVLCKIPLLAEYSMCTFNAENSYIDVSHAQKSSIKVNYESILKN
ncbi:MAG: hypothetical protein WBC60_00080 [Cognaticolwellia sp.]